MERRAPLAEMRPLRHRFQVIDRFSGLDFDDAFQPVSLVQGHQQQVRIHLRGSDFYARRLFIPGVDGNFVLALKFRLQEADDAVVLELLSNRSDQNRTQETSGEPGMVTWVRLTRKPFTFIMM